MRMINSPQAGPRGGREAMKREAKEKKKVVCLTLLFCHIGQDPGPAVSVCIYLGNKLCVNWESHLTSDFSTVNKNNLNLHLQGVSVEKSMWEYFRKSEGLWLWGYFIIYFFLLEYHIEYLLWFLQKKHCYCILFTFTLIPTTKGVINSDEEA